MNRTDIRSLSAERRIPVEVRDAISRAAFRFQVDDLNGLGDRLAYLRGENANADLVARVKARIADLIESLSWNVERVCWRGWDLAGRIERPEDAFAPALILGVLEADAPRTDAWLKGLSVEAQEALYARGFPRLLQEVRPKGQPQGHAF